ncbi:tetratricopeptide (TPR) repeat protein [Parabacteroides sp. PF5-5]|uniref:tetratricopeptide repeat protein n=1 Tax=unclassified Parabacteroides TaxID=2649774 RepID=UPI002476A9C1|nr:MULTISPECIES: tetratricopeptide repeat protein [unclassified Parabacteroides]MDH6304080.1 tetratricopeptide (TPR) repeat protein [Parabacteroides sp. PH5-39]MDH6315220.1 tetratricopeptide (TPR) repeat protein [Parabacteroides sp. PF5-13]MDH6318865.1 tetratricopeptide (TPR) repeat protein [Parabacteroides sp. PH5-13]MDH6322594.1 tetratricopeptide (TPR) repeat protein [Parabacteroides sp. PH5-8]MDH6326254.1 tetratricopeptide (TPR) repeat protein [Parabacteroides sp. PH5-41]
MKKAIIFTIYLLCSLSVFAQINTDRVLAIGRNALYFEDYVLSIQYFNQVIKAKPWLAEPYFYRAVAKINLDDYNGAEEDCDLCLQRNPFLVQAYFARGIARQSQDNYKGAIEDYNKGLEFKPEDRQMLVNKAVAYIQKKDYDQAEVVFEDLMAAHPKYSMNYLTRGAMYLEKGDTVQALKDYNQAIEMDPYYAPAYGNRAIVYYQTHKLEDALSDLNEAIRLNTREGGFYINRGLVRYQMNDLRGAMADYDQVISWDSRNLIARFNRGLLRFQVGDNNRAIEDFDVVIEEEPDNYMAYYNRALLYHETGNYIGAVQNFDVVLNQYPNFIPGYYARSEAKRKMRDNAGADRDYWTAFEIEERLKKERQTGISPSTSSTADADTSSEENTREQSDKSINKFNRLVVYDKDEERKSKYQSDVRGRVQDRNVRVDLEPLFVLTYYEKADQIKKIVYYDKMIEDFNARMILPRKLRLTNEEAPLNEFQIASHFTSINELSAKIDANPSNTDAYFGRAIDFMLVQDFSEAINDFTKVIEQNPDFTMAYFNRAVVRYKQLEYTMSQMSNEISDVSSGVNLTIGKQSQTATTNDAVSAKLKDNKRAIEHEQIVRDYDMVIKLNPGFVYAFFNRGNLRCAQRDFRAAIQDYNEAITRDPDFAEAYFNRGLARLSQGDANRGIADLSKAGELGIINAYSIIKRMTSN